jgi:hypothetical protein
MNSVSLNALQEVSVQTEIAKKDLLLLDDGFFIWEINMCGYLSINSEAIRRTGLVCIFSHGFFTLNIISNIALRDFLGMTT